MLRRRVKSAFKLAVLGAALVPAAHAQLAPTLAVQGDLGPQTGYGGDYIQRDWDGTQLGVSLRFARTRYFAGVVGLQWDGFAGSRKADLICVSHVGQNTCIPGFPAFRGMSGSLGVIASPLSRLEISGTGGVGWYSVGDENAGSASGSVDIAAFPLYHVGIVFVARRVVIPSFRGDYLSMSTKAVGFRLRY